MDTPSVAEHLGAVMDGTTTSERFAALCLVELLREICQFERAGGTLVHWEWEARVADVAAVCGMSHSEAHLVWEWCSDISGDCLLEVEDPWGVVGR